MKRECARRRRRVRRAPFSAVVRLGFFPEALSVFIDRLHAEFNEGTRATSSSLKKEGHALLSGIASISVRALSDARHGVAMC